MSLTDLPILGMLRTRMHWHQARQALLAENVANADLPGFRPRCGDARTGPGRKCRRHG